MPRLPLGCFQDEEGHWWEADGSPYLRGGSQEAAARRRQREASRQQLSGNAKRIKRVGAKGGIQRLAIIVRPSVSPAVQLQKTADTLSRQLQCQQKISADTAQPIDALGPDAGALIVDSLLDERGRQLAGRCAVVALSLVSKATVAWVKNALAGYTAGERQQLLRRVFSTAFLQHLRPLIDEQPIWRRQFTVVQEGDGRWVEAHQEPPHRHVRAEGDRWNHRWWAQEHVKVVWDVSKSHVRVYGAIGSPVSCSGSAASGNPQRYMMSVHDMRRRVCMCLIAKHVCPVHVTIGGVREPRQFASLVALPCAQQPQSFAWSYDRDKPVNTCMTLVVHRPSDPYYVGGQSDQYIVVKRDDY